MGNLNERVLVQLQPNACAIPSPLRFYDPELQNALNVEPFDVERLQRARAKAKQLNAAYLGGLAELASRMSKRTFSLFSDPRDPMFDSDLVEFSFGDSLMLLAAGIKALSVNVPSERWFDQWRSRIDSLLAHELTGEEVGYMQHAFLFASGAAISITFERVRWHTRQIPSKSKGKK
jgi:hypothetical protein